MSQEPESIAKLRATAEQMLLNRKDDQLAKVLVDAQQVVDLCRQAEQAAEAWAALKSARSRGAGREMVELWHGVDLAQGIRNLIGMAGLQVAEPEFPHGESETMYAPRRKWRWFGSGTGSGTDVR